ncbi:MAG: class I SAM-dependent methyltransferase [Ardenticatenaceae bacterium]|nr:class I SAM-dependent methyltransferase [Ardenticatenaceae bacterium]
MESWRYYYITHLNHIICNPTSPAKYDQLLSLLPLSAEDQVLEIATGKGELMTQLVERFGVSGTAVDLSPYHSQDARDKFAARIPNADITFLEMDGAAYQPEKPESFALTACLGASWIFNGHKGTLQALINWTKPGGCIIVGEPYWLQEPHPDYLQMAGLERDVFASHHQNVLTGQSLGLNLLYTLVSTHDEWDVYEGLQWHAGELYAAAHPDDADMPEFLTRLRAQKQEYLQYGRDTLGWAIYLFRKP